MSDVFDMFDSMYNGHDSSGEKHHHDARGCVRVGDPLRRFSTVSRCRMLSWLLLLVL